eukprot:131383_1
MQPVPTTTFPSPQPLTSAHPALPHHSAKLNSRARERKLPFQWHLVCGAVAGITDCCIMYPLDVIKIRQQLNRLKAGHNEPRSIAGVSRQLFMEAGVYQFYRGIPVPLAAEPIKRAYKFAANAYLQNLIAGGRKPTAAQATLAGMLTGCTEGLLIAPFDLLKVRMAARNRLHIYSSSVQCAASIWRTEGVDGFLKGASAGVMSQTVRTGSYFGAICVIKDLLWAPKTDNQEILRNIAAGTCAGALVPFLDNPFDVVAARMRNVLPGEHSRLGLNPLVNMVRIAREEGARALYKGFFTRMLRLAPCGAILYVVSEFTEKQIRTFLKYDDDVI